MGPTTDAPGTDAPGTDALGTVHPPAGPGARIVSLVPSITELLFDLGLGDRVVGRTTFCVHPEPAVDTVPRVGGTKKVRMDRLRELAPTHVIVNVDENVRAEVEAIASFVPGVVVTHPLAPHDNVGLYRLLGDIFGVEDAAGALIARFEAARARLRERVRPARRVLYLIWRAPWMTVSRDTYISRTLALVNWHTVPETSASRYPEVTLDPATLAGVDRILLSTEPFPFKHRHVAELAAEAGARLPPVELIDGEMTSWYGSRAVAGLDYLGAMADRLEMGAGAEAGA